MRARSLACSFILALAVWSGTACAAETAPPAVVTSVVDAAALPIGAAALPQQSHRRALPLVSGQSGLLTPAQSLMLDVRPVRHVPTAAAPAMPVQQRSAADFFLLILVGLTLVGYQLLRKHRLLRPQAFSL
ncbi:MAG TPA: hypothetical protein VKB34_14300 [Povalibacter sp.]|nr:hypothetical protein [Povalibacter sp.]